LATCRGKRVSPAPESAPSCWPIGAGRSGLNPEGDIAAQRWISGRVDGMKIKPWTRWFFSGGLPTPTSTKLFLSGARPR